MIILERTEKFGVKDTSTHREIFFTVPEEAREMRIHYEYAPKAFAGDGEEEVIRCYRRYGYEIDGETAKKELPLNNHLTLSLDAPDGTYVGAAHRHPNVQEITVGEKGSSFGFIPYPVTKGEWRIVLSAHAVLSEEVVARLVVEI